MCFDIGFVVGLPSYKISYFNMYYLTENLVNKQYER